MDQNTITNLYTIYTNEHFNKNYFTKFTSLIQKKHTINTFNTFINSLYNEYLTYDSSFKLEDIELSRHNVRCFLSSYVIIYFPSVMNINPNMDISKELTNVSKILHILARNILNNYKNNNTNYGLIKLFLNKFQEYVLLFDDWKEIDREAIFFNLAVTIFEMEMDFKDLVEESDMQEEDELYNITKEEVNKEIKKMYQRAIYINETGETKVKNYYNYISNFKNIASNNTSHKQRLKFFEKLEKDIETQIYTAYWDILQDDLMLEPPNTDGLEQKINELIQLICLCVPNRQDIHQELKDKLDPSFIIHKIKNDTFDENEFKNYVSYIFTKLEQFQSKNQDNILHIFKDNVFQKINNGIPLPFILREFMRFIFEQFQSIYIARNEFINNLDSS